MASRPPLTSVRIIGGYYNGRKIRVPATAQLRPSGDRLREALFSCLGGYLPGVNCLDLFAGSGALGLGAASRGAAQVTLVEKNRRNAAALEKIVGELKANAVVRAMTAQRFLAANGQKFDLVFLDPPFSEYPTDSAWARLLAALLPHVSPQVRVYCEHRRRFTPPSPWQVQTARRIGGVHWQILRLPPGRAPAQ